MTGLTREQAIEANRARMARAERWIAVVVATGLAACGLLFVAVLLHVLGHWSIPQLGQ